MKEQVQELQKIAVFTATLGISVILALVLSVPIFFGQLSEINHELEMEMDDFNKITDDIVNVLNEEESKFRQEQSQLIRAMYSSKRTKRQATCNCDTENSNKCPTGPPGPAGNPGMPGMNGMRGLSGKSGLGAMEIMEKRQPCPKCPSIPGPPGPSGEKGPTGPRGPMGMMGKSGKMGKFGQPGTVGDQGSAGPEGQQGKPGQPGKPAMKSGVIKPGQKGDTGIQGIPGMPGEDGGDGEDGPAGPEGPPGPQGPLGKSGKEGPIVGKDAAYCACPPRSLGGRKKPLTASASLMYAATGGLRRASASSISAARRRKQPKQHSPDHLDDHLETDVIDVSEDDTTVRGRGSSRTNQHLRRRTLWDDIFEQDQAAKRRNKRLRKHHKKH